MKQRAFRYEQRKSIDEIARSTLNGDLFDTYDGHSDKNSRQEFPRVPIQFEDHEQYRGIWNFLFGFELLS